MSTVATATPTAEAEGIKHIFVPGSHAVFEYQNEKGPYYEVTTRDHDSGKDEMAMVLPKIGGADISPENALRLCMGEELKLTARGTSGEYPIAVFADGVYASGWLAAHSANLDYKQGEPGQDDVLQSYRVEHPQNKKGNSLARVSVYASMGKNPPVPLSARDAWEVVHRGSVTIEQAENKGPVTLKLASIEPVEKNGRTYFNAKVHFAQNQQRDRPQPRFSLDDAAHGGNGEGQDGGAPAHRPGRR